MMSKNNNPTQDQKALLFNLILELGIDIQFQINEMLKKHDLTFPQSVLLFQIHSRSKIRSKDIASLQRTTKGAVSQMIKVMEKKGFVSRVQSKYDKRDWFIELTDIAKKVVKDINLERNEKMSFMYKEIDQKKMDLALDVLINLKNNLDYEYEK